jgi:hypothetical protein
MTLLIHEWEMKRPAGYGISVSLTGVFGQKKEMCCGILDKKLV